MRKFIVSDLHGNGEVYDSIMAYLENISLSEEVELYINGDLIDRGLDSYRMLEDVYERVSGKGNIKIHYLGGNHELLMYQALLERQPGEAFNHWSDWIQEGGYIIEGELGVRDDGEELCEVYKDFLGKLEIYHKFPETINGNKLLLVHAQAPNEIYDECHMKIADNNYEVLKAVWTREEVREVFLWFVGEVIGYNRIGKDGYLTIVGHTPVDNENGFIYNSQKGFINIDGGCSKYAHGRFDFDHVPLVEVLDNHLEILIFNHNNEIIKGYELSDSIREMNEDKIDNKKLFINHNYDNNGEENKRLIKEIMDDIKQQ